MPRKAPKKKKPSLAKSATGPRRLSLPKRVWYNPTTWQNGPVPTGKPLPKARQLALRGLKQLWAHKRLFGGIALTYGLFNLLLVQGLANTSNLTDFKSTLDNLLGGAGNKLASSFTTFVYLLGTSGGSNTATSGVYQSVLLIVCSLAFIWALRQVVAGHSVKIRDSFYQGMYPLVPFFLLFLLVGVQLLPLVIGGALYSTVITNGIAVYFWEKALFFVLFLGLALWSLRMITASIFAIYIVTLPDMTPLRALRSAKQLVLGRRLLLWRKLIFLPVFMLVVAAIIEIPLILSWTAGAAWAFFVLSTVALPFVHTYLYGLYRELL